MTTRKPVALIGYPFAGHAGIPDPLEAIRLNADCLTVWGFPTLEAAKAYTSFHRRLAHWHGESLMTIEHAHGGTGTAHVIMWWGPYNVWFHDHEYEGWGEVVGVRGNRFRISIGYHTGQQCFMVPRRNCEEWDQHFDRHRHKDRWRWSHRTQIRRRPEPILLPARARKPTVQTSERAKRRRHDVWAQL